MSLVRLKTHGQITLPAVIRDALHLEIGDYLELTLQDRKIVLTPQDVEDRPPPPLQAFPDESYGDRLLREAADEVRAGRTPSRKALDALIKALNKEQAEESDGG